MSQAFEGTMGLLDRWRLRRAAKRYAASLGPALSSAYGASEYYTPEQIRIAVGQLGLDAQFIALAYAAFLPESQFQTMKRGLLLSLSYNHCRSLLHRYRPSRPWSASGEAPESAYLTNSVGNSVPPSGGGVD